MKPIFITGLRQLPNGSFILSNRNNHNYFMVKPNPHSESGRIELKCRVGIPFKKEHIGRKYRIKLTLIELEDKRIDPAIIENISLEDLKIETMKYVCNKCGNIVVNSTKKEKPLCNKCSKQRMED